jgi:hypothetical protein
MKRLMIVLGLLVASCSVETPGEPDPATDPAEVIGIGASGRLSPGWAIAGLSECITTDTLPAPPCDPAQACTPELSGTACVFDVGPRCETEESRGMKWVLAVCP